MEVTQNLAKFNAFHLIFEIFNQLTHEEISQLNLESLAAVQSLLHSFQMKDSRYSLKSAIFQPSYHNLTESQIQNYNQKLIHPQADSFLENHVVVYRKLVADSLSSQFLKNCPAEYLTIEQEPISDGRDFNSTCPIPIVKLNYIYFLKLDNRFEFTLGDLLSKQAKLPLRSDAASFSSYNPQILKFYSRYFVKYEPNYSWCGDHTTDFKLSMKIEIFDDTWDETDSPILVKKSVINNSQILDSASDTEPTNTTNTEPNPADERRQSLNSVISSLPDMDSNPAQFTQKSTKIIFPKSVKPGHRKVPSGRWINYGFEDLFLEVDSEFLRRKFSWESKVVVTCSYEDTNCKMTKDNIKWSFVDLIVENC